MVAIQSGVAKYHCLHTQGALAFQTLGVFFLIRYDDAGWPPRGYSFNFTTGRSMSIFGVRNVTLDQDLGPVNSS